MKLLYLYQFHAQKICNMNIWIENDIPPPLPPLWSFSKNSSDLLAGPFPKCYIDIDNLSDNCKIANILTFDNFFL